MALVIPGFGVWFPQGTSMNENVCTHYCKSHWKITSAEWLKWKCGHDWHYWATFIDIDIQGCEVEYLWLTNEETCLVLSISHAVRLRLPLISKFFFYFEFPEPSYEVLVCFCLFGNNSIQWIKRTCSASIHSFILFFFSFFYPELPPIFFSLTQPEYFTTQTSEMSYIYSLFY